MTAVFGDTVVLFSDKSCAFKDTGRLQIDWNRWAKRAIRESVDQLYGAERWLRTKQDRVFVDRACITPLPFPLPSPDQMRVHRICVALGAIQKCRELFGGSGSLPFMPLPPPVTALGVESPPFTLAQADYGRGIVHVFDDVTLDIVLGELDTIADFLEYLRRKETLLTRGALLGAAGEEDLLARHLRHRAAHDGDGFGLPLDADILITEGLWTALKDDPQFLARKSLDQISYLWDRIIDTVSADVLARNLAIPINVGQLEPALRVMAGEPRFWRRVLSRYLSEFVERAPLDLVSRRVLANNNQRPETTYVFVCFPPETGKDLDGHKARARHLQEYCLAIAARHPRPPQVIGIGTEAGTDNGGRSYDLAMIRIRDWTPEIEEVAAKAAVRRRVMDPDNVVWTPSHDVEYPVVRRPGGGIRNRKPGPNAGCPCGSGKKYKKCHGQ